jgi:hypothetical protein
MRIIVMGMRLEMPLGRCVCVFASMRSKSRICRIGSIDPRICRRIVFVEPSDDRLWIISVDGRRHITTLTHPAPGASCW